MFKTITNEEIDKSSTYKEQSMPRQSALTLELIKQNKVTERMLPWDTPISCLQTLEYKNHQL